MRKLESLVAGLGRNWVYPALVISLALLAAVSVQKRDLRDQHLRALERVMSPYAGMYLPPAELPWIEGGTVAVAQGSPQVLFYLTTSCPYCRRSLDAWTTLQARLNEHGIQGIAISVSSSDSTAAYAAEHGLERVVVLDDRRLEELYRTYQVPTFIVVDSAGRIAHAHRGTLLPGPALDSIAEVAVSLSLASRRSL